MPTAYTFGALDYRQSYFDNEMSFFANITDKQSIINHVFELIAVLQSYEALKSKS